MKKQSSTVCVVLSPALSRCGRAVYGRLRPDPLQRSSASRDAAVLQRTVSAAGLHSDSGHLAPN
eukprot:33343-Hanusia_phi.AAC.1